MLKIIIIIKKKKKKKLASLKAIGYDGLLVAFYQKFWFMLKLNVILTRFLLKGLFGMKGKRERRGGCRKISALLLII